MFSFRMKPLLSILFLFLSAFFGLSSLVLRARAAGGLVCITDPLFDPASCPASPPVLEAPPGAEITVAVNIQVSNFLNGFDISVQVDPTVLRPVSIGVADSLIQDPRFIVQQTVNSTNGVAHLAMVALGYSVPSPATGNLFEVVYAVLSSSNGTDIAFKIPCSTNTTVPGVCVTLTNPVSVPVMVQTASFGPVRPDFAILAVPNFQTVQTGFSSNSTVVLDSKGLFTNTVNLSISPLSPCRVLACPSWSLQSTTLVLSSGATAWTTFTFSAPPESPDAPMSSWNLNLTGTAAGVSRSVVVSFTVLPPTDFSISVNPSSLVTQRGQSGSSTIALVVFSRIIPEIVLSASISPAMKKGPSLTLLPSIYQNGIFCGGICPPLTLLVSTTSTTHPGTYTVTVTAKQLPSESVGLLIRSVTLTVTIVANVRVSTSTQHEL